GMFLILAASPAVAEQHHWSPFYFVKKHLIFLLPTILILVGVSLLSLKEIKFLSIGVLALSVVGLILTFFMGTEIKGASRWLEVGGISIQPSEFAKSSFAIVCALFFSKQHDHSSFPGNMLAIGLYIVLASLLLLQPDLGMTALV